MDRGERGMNPVAMTIINPRKEYWRSRGSNQRLPFPSPVWGSAMSRCVCLYVRLCVSAYLSVWLTHKKQTDRQRIDRSQCLSPTVSVSIDHFLLTQCTQTHYVPVGTRRSRDTSGLLITPI